MTEEATKTRARNVHVEIRAGEGHVFVEKFTNTPDAKAWASKKVEETGKPHRVITVHGECSKKKVEPKETTQWS